MFYFLFFFLISIDILCGNEAPKKNMFIGLKIVTLQLPAIGLFRKDNTHPSLPSPWVVEENHPRGYEVLSVAHGGFVGVNPFFFCIFPTSKPPACSLMGSPHVLLW